MWICTDVPVNDGITVAELVDGRIDTLKYITNVHSSVLHILVAVIGDISNEHAALIGIGHVDKAIIVAKVVPFDVDKGVDGR